MPKSTLMTGKKLPGEKNLHHKQREMVARKRAAGSSEGWELGLRGLWLAAFLPACESLMAQKLKVFRTLPIKRRKTVKNLSSKNSRRGQSPEIWARKPKKPSTKAQSSEMTPQLQHSSTWICWNVAIFFLMGEVWSREKREKGNSWLWVAHWCQAVGWGHPAAPLRDDSPLLHTGRTAQISKMWGPAPRVWYLPPASLTQRFIQALLTARAGKQPGKGWRCLNSRVRSTSHFEGMIWVSPTLYLPKRDARQLPLHDKNNNHTDILMFFIAS